MTEPVAAPITAGRDFDTRAFRNALGSFVTGVTIVTTLDGQGAPAGLTANSFNSVSLEPPMVLWSLALDSTNLAAFRDARFWAVHVLAAGQEALSDQFARRDGAKFENVPTTEGPGGIPLLDGAAARFVCRTAFEYEGGDHAIFLGAVLSFEQTGLNPLVYHQGRYGGILPRAETPAERRQEAALATLEAQGLVARAGGPPGLTALGRDVALGFAALADTSDLSGHERSALRHLLEKLAQGQGPGEMSRRQ